LTVDVTMTLRASSLALKWSSSWTGATITVASCIARRNMKRVHSLTGAEAINASGVHSSTWCAPLV